MNGDAVGVVPATGGTYVSILHGQGSADGRQRAGGGGGGGGGGGLTALVLKKLGAKKGPKRLFQKSNPKEETTWVK